jgi:hypothetical protein
MQNSLATIAFNAETLKTGLLIVMGLYYALPDFISRMRQAIRGQPISPPAPLPPLQEKTLEQRQRESDSE